MISKKTTTLAATAFMLAFLGLSTFAMATTQLLFVPLVSGPDNSKGNVSAIRVNKYTETDIRVSIVGGTSTCVEKFTDESKAQRLYELLVDPQTTYIACKVADPVSNNQFTTNIGFGVVR